MEKSRIAAGAIIIAVSLGCTSQPAMNESDTMNAQEQFVMKNETMKLKISATYNMEIGYGTVFNCRVESVVEGKAEEGASFQLLLVKRSYADYLHKQGTCVVTFKKIRENVEENYLTTDGFIDEGKNGWEVVSIE